MCNDSWDDCDSNPSNGCETNLSNTQAHCGQCAISCTNAHGTTECLAGVCKPTCESLTNDCDGNVANGCETPLTTTNNCGACGNQCAVLAKCTASGGSYACTCDAGYAGPECRDCAVGYFHWPTNSGTCVADPCYPDPCKTKGEVAGSCSQTSATTFKCGCAAGYDWSGTGCTSGPLINGVHTKGDCYARGGTPVASDGGAPQCEFPGGGCPDATWTRYGNYSATQGQTCTGQGDPGGCGCGPWHICTVTGHGWSNVAPESPCAYSSCTGYLTCPTLSCPISVVAVGCY